jgi:hypothetical protein
MLCVCLEESTSRSLPSWNPPWATSNWAARSGYGPDHQLWATQSCRFRTTLLIYPLGISPRDALALSMAQLHRPPQPPPGPPRHSRMPPRSFLYERRRGLGPLTCTPTSCAGLDMPLSQRATNNMLPISVFNGYDRVILICAVQWRD